jgi:hypothetical protein
MAELLIPVQVIEEALLDANMTKEDVDWLVLHQANQRILDSAAQRLGIPGNKVVSNLAHYGNTSAASIPLVLDEAVRAGNIKEGDTVKIRDCKQDGSQSARVFVIPHHPQCLCMADCCSVPIFPSLKSTNRLLQQSADETPNATFADLQYELKMGMPTTFLRI